MINFRMLAMDYDSTVATAGVIPPVAIAALEIAKGAGIKLAIVTGREYDNLIAVCERIDLFELIVTENGAVLYFPERGEIEDLCQPPVDELLQELDAAGISFSRGRLIWSTSGDNVARAQEIAARLGLDLGVSYNKGWAMFLPAGVDKASGLLAGLKHLGVDVAETVCMGDAENDVVMLEIAGLAVVPSNALDEAKAVADLVMTRENGAGVAEFIHEHLLAQSKDLKRIAAAATSSS